MTTVAAFVLTGGKSSRMGQEKSALLLNGNTLLERAIEIAHAASDDVQLLGAPYLPSVGRSGIPPSPIASPVADLSPESMPHSPPPTPN